MKNFQKSHAIVLIITCIPTRKIIFCKKGSLMKIYTLFAMLLVLSSSSLFAMRRAIVPVRSMLMRQYSTNADPIWLASLLEQRNVELKKDHGIDLLASCDVRKKDLAKACVNYSKLKKIIPSYQLLSPATPFSLACGRTEYIGVRINSALLEKMLLRHERRYHRDWLDSALHQEIGTHRSLIDYHMDLIDYDMYLETCKEESKLPDFGDPYYVIDPKKAEDRESYIINDLRWKEYPFYLWEKQIDEVTLKDNEALTKKDLDELLALNEALNILRIRYNDLIDYTPSLREEKNEILTGFKH